MGLQETNAACVFKSGLEKIIFTVNGWMQRLYFERVALYVVSTSARLQIQYFQSVPDCKERVHCINEAIGSIRAGLRTPPSPPPPPPPPPMPFIHQEKKTTMHSTLYI